MTTHQLILRTLGELREENPLMSQVTDVWYDRTSRKETRIMFLVYKGSIYQTNIQTSNRYLIPEEQTPEYKQGLLKTRILNLLDTIRVHEEEGRFNRRGQYHLYPGLAS